MAILNPWSQFPSLPQPSLRQYVVLPNPGLGGLLQVLALGADDSLYTAWQDGGSATGWTQWQAFSSPPVGIADVPAVAAGDTGGQITLFVYGGDSQVWAASLDVSNPAGLAGAWVPIGAPPSGLSNIVFAAGAGTNLNVVSLFTIGYNDGALWTTWPDASAPNGWAPWISLGFPGTRLYSLTSYCIGANADGRLEGFALAVDGSLWHLWLQPTWVSPGTWQAARPAGGPDSGWSMWVQLAPPTGSSSGPAIGGALTYPMVTSSDGNGNVEVYLTDDTGSLWGIGQTALVSAPTSPTWSDWVGFELDPNLLPTSGSLGAGRNADGREELFVVDANGGVWHAYNPAGGTTGGTANVGLLASWYPPHFAQIGTDTQSNIQVASNPDGRLELFGISTSSSQLCHVWESAPNDDSFVGASLGIVLGGGGTACDFQVGALRYLRDVVGIQSGIICGTSMGAFNAAKFAEGNLDQLQEFWLDLKFPDDILAEEPWFVPTMGGGPHGNVWLVDAIEQSFFQPVTVPSAASALTSPSSITGDLGKGISALSYVFKALASGYPSFTYSVFASTAEATATEALGATLSTVGQGLGYVGFIIGLISLVMQLESALLPGDNRLNDIANFYNGLVTQMSLFNLLPLLRKIGGIGIDSALIENNSSSLLIGLTGVDDGGLYFVTETGQLIPSSQNANLSGTVAPVNACVASAALSPFAPPIMLGVNPAIGEFFDGSLRDAVPLNAAISHGAGAILAIVPCGPTPPELPANYFATTDPSQYSGVLGIQSRANDVSAHTIQGYSSDLDPSIVTLIQPTFTPHNHWAVDPGLISIAMAYGFMRAGEVMNGNTALSPISDQIVALRFQIWDAENSANSGNLSQASQGHFGFRASGGSGLVPTNDASQIPRIREFKNQLRALVCQYQQGGGVLPSVDFRANSEVATLSSLTPPFNVTDFRAWWIQWERHVYAPQPGSPTPWHQFIDDAANICPAVSSGVVAAMLDPCAVVPLPPTPTPL